MSDITQRLADRIQLERESRGWTLAELAERSGVSRAMISKIERHEASPTAVLLGRLSGAFGIPISTLLARAEEHQKRLVRKKEQPLWQDPKSGYLRQTLSPRSNSPLQLTRVELPPLARIPYPAEAYRFTQHQIWVLQGELQFTEGDEVHHLYSGDCLELGHPQPCEYANITHKPCIYLVALSCSSIGS